MALNAIMSMFPGALDCAMRDRSEGFCAGAREKRSGQVDAPLVRPKRFEEPAHHACNQTLPWRPSSSLSEDDLSRHSLSSAGSSVFGDHTMRARGPGHSDHWTRNADVAKEGSGYQHVLPSDFFYKLGNLISRDREVQNKILTGDMQFFTGHNTRSRFLHACIKDDREAANQLWRGLNTRDRQALLLTYSSGPPSPDFFANMMSNDSASDSGSSSTDFDIASDTTLRS